MDRDRLATYVLLGLLFLLPWQTRFFLYEFTLDGDVWEYGKLSLYAVELLLLVVYLLRKKHIPLVGASKPIGYGILLIGGAFVSIGLSQSAALGFGQIFHLCAAFLLFYLLLDKKIKTEQMIFAFCAGLFVPAILGWVQVITTVSPSSTLLGLASHDALVLGQSVVETESGRVLRAYGSFSHPNVFGGFLSVGLFILAWLAYKWRDQKEKWTIAALIVFYSATIVLTFSRSAWLSLIIGFIVLLALMLWFRKLPPKRVFPLASLALCAIIVTLIVFNTAVFTRFSPNARLEAKSIQERSGEYSQMIDIVKTNPFTGVGIGQYTLAYGKSEPGLPVWVYQPIHNTIILIFVETGLIGFILFVMWFTSIDQINYKVKKMANGMFGMGLGTVVLVLALFDHYLWSSWAGLALAAFCFALMLRWSLEVKTPS
jgi:O-antigen ligase